MARFLFTLILASCLLLTFTSALVEEVEEDLSQLHSEDWETWDGFDPTIVADDNDFIGEAPEFEIIDGDNATEFESVKRYTRRSWWQRYDYGSLCPLLPILFRFSV